MQFLKPEGTQAPTHIKDAQTDRQTGSQAGRHEDIQAGRQTDTHRQTETHMSKQSHSGPHQLAELLNGFSFE